jgi:hypothetical protein
MLIALSAASAQVRLDAPATAQQWDVAEFTLHVSSPAANPFMDLHLEGEFRIGKEAPSRIAGFADSDDGRLYRLRFAPDRPAVYTYRLTLRGAGVNETMRGELRAEPSTRPGPVIVDPANPKHFVFAGSKQPFFHLGFTAYHLLDPSNDDTQVDATIDYCARLGFNKIRFLLTGYPRDTRTGTSKDVEHGVPDPARAPNYGALPGRLNPLPAWPGEPHRYDFTRFRTAYWQRVDRAVRGMRERGIVANAIVTIEKQDLPQEYGRLTPNEFRLYRYAVARLAAFDNVWFDLGNEHNEFRDASWGEAMGSFVSALDPHRRLISAHAYAEFFYPRSVWASYVLTQHYGTLGELYNWALQHRGIPKPYVNEEYGYEGNSAKPGHSQNADLTRQGHWSIAMAGGYATYGDWSGGVSWFYMGVPGKGIAVAQLQHLRRFFEDLPFPSLSPAPSLIDGGFCLSGEHDLYVFYLTAGVATIDLSRAKKTLASRWFDPRTGAWQDGPQLKAGSHRLTPPAPGDWALVVK